MRVFAFCSLLVTASVASADPVVTVNGSATPVTVSPGASLSVSIAGSPGNPTDWVGIYVPTAADGSFLSWVYLNGSTTPPATGLTSATVTFSAPAAAGTYEFRLFANNAYTRLTTSAIVTVRTLVVTVNGSAAPVSVLPGQTLTVSIAASPGNPTDWLGLSVPSAGNTSFISWWYLNGTTTPPATGLTSVTLTISAPVALGPYEFRLFANKGYTRLATSATVTVAATGYIVYDTFTDPSGTLVTAHSPDTNVIGRPWTVVSGTTPVLSNGRLSANAESLTLIDGGTPNASVSVTWYPGTGATLDAGLVFRAVDAQNFFLFRMLQDRLALYRVVRGQWTQVWVNPLEDGEPRGQAHTLSVELSDATITVMWDFGVQLYTIHDYAHIQGRLYGLRWTDADPASTYDAFRVYGALPAPPASVTVSGLNTLVFNGQTALTARAYDAANVEIPNTSFLWASSNPSIVSLGPVSANTVLVTGTGIGETAITATPSRGPNGTAPMRVTPGSTIVYDTFTGPTGRLLADHLPEVNQMAGPWDVGGGLHPVLSENRLSVSGTVASDYALIDAGTPNVAVAVNWTPGTAANLVACLIFRATDPQNYFAFQMFFDRLRLSRVVNGVSTELALQFLDGEPRTGTHTLQVALSGPTIEASWDGGVYVFTLTDLFNINATRYGLRWWNLDTTSTYDNFRVTGALAPPATRVAVTPSVTEVPFHGSVILNAVAYDASDQVIPGTTFFWSSSHAAAKVVAATASSAYVTGMGEGTATVAATAVRGGAGAAINVTVNPGTTLVFDSFTGPDGATLAGRVPEVSQLDGTWAVTGTPGAVLRGQRAGVLGSGTMVMALIEGGAPDANVAATWTPGNGTTTAGYLYGGLVARASDDENYLTVSIADPFVGLARVSYGTWTTIGSVRMPDDYFRGSNHRVELRMLGPNIEVWIDGVRQIEALDNFNLGATKSGLRWWSTYDSASTYDDFAVVGTIPPIVHTMTVSPSSLTVAPYETTKLSAVARNSAGQIVPGAVVAWSSSTPTVARVTPSAFAEGTVMPMTLGTANITATVPRGTAPDVTIPVTVRICVDALPIESASVPHDGRSVTAFLTAPAECTWRAVPLANWLSVSSGAAGSGNGAVTITAAANSSRVTRTGQVAIGGRLFAITQPPPPNQCVTGMSPGQTNFPAEGGYGDFGVVADPNCIWVETSSDSSWLVPLEGTGQGSGSPRFRVLPNNTGAERTATMGVGGSGFPVTQAAGSAPCGTCSPPADWNTVTVDIAISTHRIGPNVPPGAAHTTHFHWERSSATGSWRTTTTFVGASPDPVMTLDGLVFEPRQFGVSRVEDDENGTPLRFYDRQGILIPQLTEAERQQLGSAVRSINGGSPRTNLGPDWIESLLVPLSKHDVRRAALTQQFGPVVGTVNGFDRYLGMQAGDQVEVLVDHATAIPVEVNIVRDGTLVTHRTYAYNPASDEKLVRATIRTEQLVPDRSGTHAVSIIEFSNVRLERR